MSNREEAKQIVLEKPAQKFLKRLNRTDKERILKTIYRGDIYKRY